MYDECHRLPPSGPQALAALFMMNNLHYIVKAVESSEALTVLGAQLGEEWIELHKDQARLRTSPAPAGGCRACCGCGCGCIPARLRLLRGGFVSSCAPRLTASCVLAGMSGMCGCGHRSRSMASSTSKRCAALLCALVGVMVGQQATLIACVATAVRGAA